MNYSQRSFMIDSRISMGPVADIILRGWPANSEKRIPHTEPAKMHSIVAYIEAVWRIIFKYRIDSSILIFY